MYRTANITFLLWVSLQRSRFNFSKFVLLKNIIFFYETFDQQGGMWILPWNVSPLPYCRPECISFQTQWKSDGPRDLSSPSLPLDAMLVLWRLSGPFRAGSHQPHCLSYGDTSRPLQCCSNEPAGDLLKRNPPPPPAFFFSAHLPAPSVHCQKGSYLSIHKPETHAQHLSRLQSPWLASASMVSRYTEWHTETRKHTAMFRRNCPLGEWHWDSVFIRVSFCFGFLQKFIFIESFTCDMLKQI